MKNYKYVLDWSDKRVDHSKILESLDYAWRYTPSKNNFMNYSVFVLGPDKTDLKELIYYKCLEQQSKSNGNHIKDIEGLKEYEKQLLIDEVKPQFFNVKRAPYLILYTHRVETQVNSYQQRNIDKGMIFEQMFAPGTKKYDSAKKGSRLEVGMFATNFATKCLEHGIDISYVGCMPTDLSSWKEENWYFIEEQPIIIQLAGHGSTYRRSIIQANEDLKPDFNRVVKLL